MLTFHISYAFLADLDSIPWKHAHSITTEERNQAKDGKDKCQKSKLEPGHWGHSSRNYSRAEGQLKASEVDSKQCKINQRPLLGMSKVKAICKVVLTRPRHPMLTSMWAGTLQIQTLTESKTKIKKSSSTSGSNSSSKWRMATSVVLLHPHLPLQCAGWENWLMLEDPRMKQESTSSSTANFPCRLHTFSFHKTTVLQRRAQ